MRLFTDRRQENPAPPTLQSATTVPARKAMTTRLAIWSATHRRIAFGVWLLMIVGFVALGAAQAPKQATSQDLTVGEAARAAQIAAEAGHSNPAVENILITARAGNFDIQEGQIAALEAISTVRTLPGISRVDPAVTAEDGRALLVQVTMEGDPDTADERVTPLVSAVADVQADHSSLRVEEVGPASISQDFQGLIGKELSKATTLSVPVTLAILLLVFGAIVMAGIPIVLALSSVGAGLGLWAVASQVVPDPGTTMDLIVLLGMAVGVDYSLFYLRRFREERHRGADDAAAITAAAATAGHSVVVSGIAVILSMAGLYLAGDGFSVAMATGSILVVAVALISSLTVLPAMLAGLGRWVDKPRIPVVWRISGGTREPRVLVWLIKPVLSHPLASFVACVALLVLLAAPVVGMSLKTTQIEDYPRTLPSMQVYDRLLQAFPGNSASDTVVVTVPATAKSQLTQQLEAMTTQVTSRTDLFLVPDEPWVSADGLTAVIDIPVPHSLASVEARESVSVLREDILPATIAQVPGVNYAVGGDIAGNMDYTENLNNRLPLVVGVVLALIFVMMFVAYRSLAVSLITVVLNGLSMAAAFGVLTLIFQGTWAQGLLGFTSTGHVVSWVPMLLFVVLSGLSLDYHVFVVSRIRENVGSGMSVKEAIRDGLVRTAGVVTSAALVMIAVFSIFGTLSFIELKQIGVGLAVGIILDATLIRIVALPALMLMCQRLLWWPGHSSEPSQSPSETAGSDKFDTVHSR